MGNRLLRKTKARLYKSRLKKKIRISESERHRGHLVNSPLPLLGQETAKKIKKKSNSKKKSKSKKKREQRKKVNLMIIKSSPRKRQNRVSLKSSSRMTLKLGKTIRELKRKVNSSTGGKEQSLNDLIAIIALKRQKRLTRARSPKRLRQRAIHKVTILPRSPRVHLRTSLRNPSIKRCQH